MTKPDNGGPAFPRDKLAWDFGSDDMTMRNAQPGMTLRDYFAAKAMHALMTIPFGEWKDANGSQIGNVDQYASESYAMADAMLEARQA
jgi:hypothetical protein